MTVVPATVPTFTRDDTGQITIDWPTGHSPGSTYLITGELLEATVAEHNRIHAGADPAPREPGALPTPGQLWHQLINATPDDRAGLLTRLIDNTNRAADCFAEGHVDQIAHYRRVLGRR